MKTILFVLAIFGIAFGIFNSEIVLPTIDVDGYYIYVFKPEIPEDQRTTFFTVLKSFSQSSIEIFREFKIGDFHGFVGKVNNPETASIYGNHSYIKYYTRDGIAYAQHLDSMTCQTDSTDSWGLNRVSTRQLDNDGLFRYNKDGEGVNAYIIDSGIYLEHEDFQGRATWGKSFIQEGYDRDCNGHGTNVAGIVGGHKYGIAKRANLIAVKVLNCYGGGTWSRVIAAIEWVVQQHKQKGVPSTINMSLGGEKNQAINDAVNAAVEAGISVAVPAGNNGGDACQNSPAAAELAITVGSTQKDDKRSSFSAVGTCVDIFAPGTGIKTTNIGTPTSIFTVSGTSISASHVCGVATQILGENGSLTPQEVKDRIIREASSGIINLDCTSDDHPSCSQSPNKLLHSSC